MAKTLAICNQKGGVGKTTTAVNLAAALALSGKQILLVDLDPQANATGGLGLEKKNIIHSIYQVLLEEFPVKSALIATKVDGLWLLPAQVALSGAEVELVGLDEREHRLKSALDSLRGIYDLMLIDCPPSLGLLTVNALTASDSVLIPLQCEYYALEGLSQLLETIRLVQKKLNSQLAIEGVLLTMADFRTKLTNDVIQEVRRFFGPKVYDVVIPRSVRLSEAPSRGLPISLYDPGSIGAKAYQILAQQLLQPENLEESNDGNTVTRVRQRDPGLDPGGESATEPWFAGEPASEGRSHLGPSGVDPNQSIPTSEETG